MKSVLDRWTAPAALLGGLLLVGLSLPAWGKSDEGVQPTISGLGRVTAPGVSAADLAFLEEHTLRPGVGTVFAGIVVAIAAALLWWRPEALMWPALAIIGLGALGAIIQGLVVFANPAGSLLDELVNAELGSDMPRLTPGYGLYGVTIVGVGLLALAIAATAARLLDSRQVCNALPRNSKIGNCASR